MTDHWTDRLSEYLDGELEAADRAALERHLASCAECAATLAELGAVVARAAELQPRPPAADLWPGVEAKLDRVTPVVAPIRSRVARRVSFTMPQLVAAGLALMVTSGGAVWMLQRGGKATDIQAVAPASNVDPSTVPVALADPRYDEAVADLEQALTAGRDELDPETVKVLESSLAAIDQAIEQSRSALATDPANVYLHSHLAEARQRKLALLRRGVGLINPKG
jgi:hypothetical protein